MMKNKKSCKSFFFLLLSGLGCCDSSADDNEFICYVDYKCIRVAKIIG